MDSLVCRCIADGQTQQAAQEKSVHVFCVAFSRRLIEGSTDLALKVRRTSLADRRLPYSSPLGEDPGTKSDDFLEKFQTAFNPPTPHFWKIILQIFYNGYGRIYARRHRPDSIS